MRRRLWRLVAAVALTAAAGAAVPVAGPAAPAAAATCGSGGGVTVIVDFRELGGGVQGQCVRDGGGQRASSLFPAAGFPLEDVRTENGFFVCRVSGAPDSSREDCVDTPPADAYWGLWWSTGDGRWSYSNYGANGLKVPDGAWVGFSWKQGAGEAQAPRVTPRTPAPQPSPSPQPSPTPAPQQPPSAQPSTPSGGAGGQQGRGGSAPAGPGASSPASPASTGLTGVPGLAGSVRPAHLVRGSRSRRRASHPARRPARRPPLRVRRRRHPRAPRRPTATRRSPTPPRPGPSPTAAPRDSPGGSRRSPSAACSSAPVVRCWCVDGSGPARVREVRTPLPRDLHPVAWWCWAIGLAASASLTTNPYLLVLVVGVAGLVVAARRSDHVWSRSFRFYLWLGAITVVLRVLWRVLLGGYPGEVVLDLPEVPLPDFVLGVTILGPVTREALLSGLYDGLRLGAVVMCVGAANALANPQAAAAVAPARAVRDRDRDGGGRDRAAAAHRRASAGCGPRRRCGRGRPAGCVGLRRTLVPVLEDTFERSLALAAGMDTRGYGRSGTATAAERRTTGALMLAGLVGVCVGVYAVLDQTAPRVLAAPMLVAGVVVAGGGFVLAGRRVERTRYRADRWRPAEVAVAVSGLVVATSAWWVDRYQFPIAYPDPRRLAGGEPRRARRRPGRRGGRGGGAAAGQRAAAAPELEVAA